MSHGTAILMELFVIFIWAKAFAEIFEQLHIPSVLGEIAAGALLGPHAIALVKPNDLTFSIAEVGAVFLLLSVGLETKPQELIRVGGKSLGVALGGVLLPFIAGFSYIVLAGYSPHEATFVGAAMVATSVAVTARVLTDLGVLGSDSAKIILGAAIFDDILGMLTLAIVAGLAAPGGIHWLQLAVLSLEAIGFALVMIFLAPRLIHRVRARIEGLAVPHAPVFLAMGLGLGFSAAAEKIGLAAIIGAFFTGLAFADYGDEWKIRPRVEGVSDFLAPFFFFTIGTQLNLNLFTSPSLWLTAIIISLLAIVSKLVGCGLPILAEGWHTALQVGIGMIPRAEVGLIVAALGLQTGLISDSTYAIVVLMAMVTTIVTPPFLRMQFRSLVPITLRPEEQTGKTTFIKLKPLVGVAVAALIALGLSIVFRGVPGKASVPPGFLIVILITARLWGRLAGVLATAIAALMFSMLLFSPLGSWAVNDEAAKANLGWMILGGMMLSHFAGRRSIQKVRSL